MSLGWPGNASGSPRKSWRKCLGLFINGAFQRILSLPRAAGLSASGASSCPLVLTRRLALAKKHTHEECKECHEVNVMASQ
ncbi:hypothetical protein L3Q82_025054 [Scortum barcoo]|uniref:Uncharacterized protein n=1 Tax=Scortum barcoo TaxID=214431 RepID=A0ACB8WQJ8_9TELE|nr:hypothetical protein L3Q82_025054 [Scortum barcoo]